MSQVEPHLTAKFGVGACSCTVATLCASLDDVIYQVKILQTGQKLSKLIFSACYYHQRVLSHLLLLVVAGYCGWQVWWNV